MMIKPEITELLKHVDSRYTLVAMAAKRARMIGDARTEDPEAYGDEKPVTVAASEISTGKVGYVRSEAIKRARMWEDEKAANILSLNTNDGEETSDVEEDTEDADSEETASDDSDTEGTEEVASEEADTKDEDAE